MRGGDSHKVWGSINDWDVNLCFVLDALYPTSIHFETVVSPFMLSYLIGGFSVQHKE